MITPKEAFHYVTDAEMQEYTEISNDIDKYLREHFKGGFCDFSLNDISKSRKSISVRTKIRLIKNYVEKGWSSVKFDITGSTTYIKFFSNDIY